MKITVSIVEDDGEARKLLVGWIKRAEGFQFVSDHCSAENALEVLPEEKPNVVLMDINLPGINGVECVRRLKPLLPASQFVMLTVYEDADHIFNALSALLEVSRGGSPMASNIARRVVQSFQEPSPSPAPKEEELSGREQEVLNLLARGYLYKEIAESLNISVATVNTYIRRIYEKLHVRSRAQAVAKFTRYGQPEGRAKSA